MYLHDGALHTRFCHYWLPLDKLPCKTLESFFELCFPEPMYSECYPMYYQDPLGIFVVPSRYVGSLSPLHRDVYVVRRLTSGMDRSTARRILEEHETMKRLAATYRH
jgi:hypothetical protein